MNIIKNRYLLLFVLFIVLSSNNKIVAQKHGTGYVFDNEAYQRVPLIPKLRGWKLPNKHSLKPYAPIPKNQGILGNCVGWTTSYVSFTILNSIAEENNNKIDINENAFSPFFVYESVKAKNDIDCFEGTNMLDALKTLKDVGTVKYKDFSQECGKIITTKHKDIAKSYKISNYRRLFENYNTNDEEKIRRIKTSISEGKPVMSGIQCCHPSFLSASGEVWKPSTIELENEPSGGHAITIIGYDDLKYGGAFELMNSWGTAWGNKGFIWIPYKDFAKYCFEAYEMNIVTEKKVKLKGELNFKLSAGMDMKAKYLGNSYYEMEKAYGTGTQFQFFITNEQPAYVYAFVSDLSKKNYQVFPYDKKISPYLAYKKSQIIFPDEKHYIELDNNIGTDYFCVLYSNEKLDIATILKQIENAHGDFKQRIKAVLRDKTIEEENIKYSNDGSIKFEGKGKGEKVLIPIIVSIKHI